IKPVVIINPDTQVFRGERVTFRCNMMRGRNTEWTYSWYENDNTPLHHTTQTFTWDITGQYWSYYGGKYTCRGTRISDSQVSEMSDAVTLSVSAKPKATVRVNPVSSIYTGDRVTLSCDLQSTGWTFLWYKDQKLSPLSDGAPVANTLEVTVSNEGEINYYCKARRGEYESEFSDAATITVRARPQPVVKVQPAESVFTGESVTLTCEIQTGGSWQYHWYRNDEKLPQSPTEVNTYTIDKVKESNKGGYTCEGTKSSDPKSTERSAAVTLTVSESSKRVLIIKPDTQVFRGERVTFRCNIQTGGDTEWTYSWYKNDNTQLRDTTQEISFDSVTDSDGGKYTCWGNRNDSQLSNISDAVTVSVSEKPKPDLTSDVKGAALTGNSVTLSCTLKLQSAGWKFYWITPTQSSETETETSHYFISSVSVSDGGQYKCRAGRGDTVYYTHYSDALWVKVT
ncbi:immunoglobulin superfamily member 1-like isoform X1, partial [Clarias magur]